MRAMPVMDTFDEIAAKYDADPVAFIEGIWRERFEYPVADDPYCAACRIFGKRITRKDHTSRNIPQELLALRPNHQFEQEIAFYPLSLLTREQLIEQIRRFQRNHWDSDLLRLYLREKFTKTSSEK